MAGAGLDKLAHASDMGLDAFSSWATADPKTLRDDVSQQGVAGGDAQAAGGPQAPARRMPTCQTLVAAPMRLESTAVVV
jgi:hypothetical protein